MTTRVAVAALAGAAVLAACAPAVTGTPTAGVPVGSTALKSDRVTVSPRPARAFTWGDVTDELPLTWDRGEPFPTVYASVPTPGAAIVTVDGGMCTLAAELKSEDGQFSGYATAGHCNPAAGDRMISYNSSPDQRLTPLSAMSDVVDGDTGADSGVIWTNVPGTSAIVGEYRVAGVLTAAGIDELVPLGSMVCRAGAVSGVDCGGRLSSDQFGRLRFATASTDGDSGGPVFSVDPVTGYAVLLGIVERTDDVSTTATLLEPTLQRLRATAVVDDAAARTVAGQSGFSTRVTPSD